MSGAVERRADGPDRIDQSPRILEERGVEEDGDRGGGDEEERGVERVGSFVRASLQIQASPAVTVPRAWTPALSRAHGRERRRRAAECDDRRLFRGEHHSGRRPAANAHPHDGFHVSPNRGEERGNEEDEDRLLDVEPAVIDHGGETAEQSGRGQRTAPGPALRRKSRKKSRVPAPKSAGTSRRIVSSRRPSVCRPAALADRAASGNTGSARDGRPGRSGTRPSSRRRAELDGLVGLVVVHGPEAESRVRRRSAPARHDEEEPAEGRLFHLAGMP